MQQVLSKSKIIDNFPWTFSTTKTKFAITNQKWIFQSKLKIENGSSEIKIVWPRIWNKTTKLDMKYSTKYSRKKVSDFSRILTDILDCFCFFHRITCSRCVTPTKTDWASWTWTGKTLLPSCLINLVCSPPSITPRMFHTLMTSEILLHLRHCAHPPWHYTQRRRGCM